MIRNDVSTRTIIELYVTRKMSQQKVGNRVGISASAVRLRLVAAGIEIRSHGKRLDTDQEWPLNERVFRKWQKGVPVAGIAAQLGMSAHEARARLHISGVNRIGIPIGRRSKVQFRGSNPHEVWCRKPDSGPPWPDCCHR